MQLHDDAERRPGTETILLFERLRDDAAQLLGTGGSRAAFLRLANAHDASEACDFIGRSHQWVESQYSRNVSQTLTSNQGTSTSTSTSTSSGLGPSTSTSSWGTGTTEGVNIAGGTGEAFTTQRVYEYVTEPSVVQGLPLNMLMFVEIAQDGHRRVTNVDFTPDIAVTPYTADHPLPR
jgi:hypothetical protein